MKQPIEIPQDHPARKELTQLRDRVKKLEREWLVEYRIIKVLVAAGYVTDGRVAQARAIVENLQ